MKCRRNSKCDCAPSIDLAHAVGLKRDEAMKVNRREDGEAIEWEPKSNTCSRLLQAQGIRKQVSLSTGLLRTPLGFRMAHE